MSSLQIFGIGGLPEIEPGADLAGSILRAAIEAGQPLADGDVVVVTSKIVSKSYCAGIRAEAEDIAIRTPPAFEAGVSCFCNEL